MTLTIPAVGSWIQVYIPWIDSAIILSGSHFPPNDIAPDLVHTIVRVSIGAEQGAAGYRLWLYLGNADVKSLSLLACGVVPRPYVSTYSGQYDGRPTVRASREALRGKPLN
jgi:hypothetical protein